MHRRIDIAEIPFIGRDLSRRMQEQPDKQQIELLPGKIDVDRGERQRVKGKVPSRKPGIFLFVQHPDDMIADHVEPFAVSHRPEWRPQRLDVVLTQPFIDLTKEILFAPQHPGKRLAHHIGDILTNARRCYGAIKTH